MWQVLVCVWLTLPLLTAGEWSKNHNYASSASNSTLALPTFLLLHGGLWQSGDRQDLYEVCEALVVQGSNKVNCVTVDYQYSQDLDGCCDDSCHVQAYQAQLAQAQLAYRYVTQLSQVDATRIVVGGHSAGAHLAWFGVLNNSFSTHVSAPAGVVGIEGIYNISLWETYDSDRWHGQFRCATRKAFGSPTVDPQGWQDGSPTFLARTQGLSVPGLLVHSPQDDWVQASQVTQLSQVLQGRNATIVLHADIKGECAFGQHEDVLRNGSAVKLAKCMLAATVNSFN